MKQTRDYLRFVFVWFISGGYTFRHLKFSQTCSGVLNSCGIRHLALGSCQMTWNLNTKNKYQSFVVHSPQLIIWPVCLFRSGVKPSLMVLWQLWLGARPFRLLFFLSMTSKHFDLLEALSIICYCRSDRLKRNEPIIELFCTCREYLRLSE